MEVKNKRVQVKNKVIPTSFLKIEGKGTFVGAKDREKEGQLHELAGNHNPGPEAPPRRKKGREKREPRRCMKSDGEG